MTKSIARPAGILMAALLALAPARATTTAPDAGHYTASDSVVFSFIDLTVLGGSASVLTNTDDATALLTLPFPFIFYGSSYNLLCVSSNGIAYFVTGAAACNGIADFQNVDLTATAAPGDLPALAPLWTDHLFQNGGGVYYQTQGAIGSRKFIVQWNNAYPQSRSLSSNPMTFELVLNEGANQVLFQYKTVNLGSANVDTDGALSTVGIRAPGGNTNGKVTQWSYDAGVLSDGKAILFAPGYTWIPPAQLSVTATAPGAARGSAILTGSITLKNISAASISGPWQILLTSLPSGVIMTNASGSFAGEPYLTVSSPASLAPGQSVTVTVQFSDPSNVKFSEVMAIYTGSLQ